VVGLPIPGNITQKRFLAIGVLFSKSVDILDFMTLIGYLEDGRQAPPPAFQARRGGLIF
jgi:hypothetical protein